MSKLRLAPHSLVLLAEQVMVGTLLSTVAMVWLQVLVLPQASVTSQVLVATKVLPQVRLVMVLRIVIVLVPPHPSLEVGMSKFRSLPHSLVLFAEQAMKGGVV